MKGTQPIRSNGQQPVRQPFSREALLEGISKQQAGIERLDRERGDARSQLAALQADLAWPESSRLRQPARVRDLAAAGDTDL